MNLNLYRNVFSCLKLNLLLAKIAERHCILYLQSDCEQRRYCGDAKGNDIQSDGEPPHRAVEEVESARAFVKQRQKVVIEQLAVAESVDGWQASQCGAHMAV